MLSDPVKHKILHPGFCETNNNDFKLKTYLSVKLEKDKQILERSLRFAGKTDLFNVDPLLLPPSTAGNLFWDFMEEKKKSRILGGIARNSIKRAIRTMPIYANFKKIDVTIKKIDDIAKLPFISKDNTNRIGFNVQGFREKVIKDKNLLIPNDILLQVSKLTKNNYNKNILKKVYKDQAIWNFPSGGSMGKRTWTTLTYLDLEIESYALAFRCLMRGGFYPGAKFLSLYNESHKGGFNLKRASEILNIEYFGKDRMSKVLNKKFGKKWTSALNRLENKTSSNINLQHICRMIAEFIRENKINIIASVQPPNDFVKKNEKGSMLTFEDIYNNASDIDLKSLKIVFLTGFPVPLKVYKLLTSRNIAVFTTWGSTESMANATHPIIEKSTFHPIASDINSLTNITYPNYWQTVKYDRRNNSWKNTEINNPGYIHVTNLHRIGTIYFNYRIGDMATKTEIGVKNIHRSKSNHKIDGSCASDAMSL